VLDCKYILLTIAFTIKLCLYKYDIFKMLNIIQEKIMKKVIYIMFFCLLPVSFAHAGWIEDFVSIFKSKGIDQAVVQALKGGERPEAIISEGLKLKELNPQNLLRALYCAGVKGDDIKAASDAAGISELLLVAAYEKSIAECGDQVVDTQAYTPAQTAARSFAGIPSPGSSGGSTYASPSTFQR
jgi:hypothetical protein